MSPVRFTQNLGRFELAIINRSFWPVYPVIGEALLQLAEQASTGRRVCAITQDRGNLREDLSKASRGQGVSFFPVKALSESSSGIALRVADALFFMVWVAIVLLRTRPRLVYVSTDPPVVVPFIVMCYARLFGAEYVYHLQDIHPEATRGVVSVNPVLFRLLKWLDVRTIRNARSVITITDEMAGEIQLRSDMSTPVIVLANPAVSFDGISIPLKKKPGFAFCGNAGRLQRLPLLIEAIEEYIQSGGRLEFAFAGGGVYARKLQELAQRFSQVKYHGVVPAEKAAQLNADYEWSLLPIEDEVTRYAFPSKASSYVYSGSKILAVCGELTSVARWVVSNRLGFVVRPEVPELCAFFQGVESGALDFSNLDPRRVDLKKSLKFETFVRAVERIIFSANKEPVRKR